MLSLNYALTIVYMLISYKALKHYTLPPLSAPFKEMVVINGSNQIFNMVLDCAIENTERNYL